MRAPERYVFRAGMLGAVFTMCLTGAAPACAVTGTEATLKTESMPHLRMTGASSPVKAHWVRLVGFLEGRPNNATRLQHLKAMADACATQRRASGQTTLAIARWPDHLLNQRIDHYATATHSITYLTTLTYGLNPSDCSLLEVLDATATVTSPAGSCSIDFKERTASGACQGTAPTGAITSGRSTTTLRPRPEPVGADALKALREAMQKYAPRKTGARKALVGLECEVWQNPLDPNGSVCLTTQGTFIAANAAADQGLSGMPLELTSPEGVSLQAAAAQLDTLISVAVFTPHLTNHFSTSRKGAGQ